MSSQKASAVDEVTVQLENRNALGDRIRDVMGTTSARAFASQLGVAHTTLNKYLLGDTEPSFSVLMKISEISGCSIEWLMRGVNSSQLSDEKIGILESVDRFNIEIPYYDVRASAGSGNLIFSEEKKSILTIPRKMIGLREDHNYYLFAFDITGDSMEPTIHDGDLVVCIASGGSIERDGVYALNINGELFVKRVTREPGIRGNSWRISSDNPAYQPMLLSDEEREGVRAIGMVLWPQTRRR